jgi:plastocyanin
VTKRLIGLSMGMVGASALLIVACGGGSPGSPSSTTTTSTGGSTSATFTIANNAVSPKSITVSPGTRVTFVNNDNRNHDMNSDPHPDHTDCPEINQVGFLTPGQSRQTGNLNTVRTCGFHDHNQDTNNNLKGSIIIQ